CSIPVHRFSSLPHHPARLIHPPHRPIHPCRGGGPGRDVVKFCQSVGSKQSTDQTRAEHRSEEKRREQEWASIWQPWLRETRREEPIHAHWAVARVTHSHGAGLRVYFLALLNRVCLRFGRGGWDCGATADSEGSERRQDRRSGRFPRSANSGVAMEGGGCW
ncbi:hypothetical protein M758_7G112600, partial [Ceratodon purpureus]